MVLFGERIVFLDGQGRLLDIKIVELVGLVILVNNRYVVDGHFHNRPDNFRFFVANAVPDMEILEKRVGEDPTRAVVGAVNVAFALVVLDDFPGARALASHRRPADPLHH